ncbi:tRNA (adenosine(37)-N6)-threonylcarbamoyltransferase complex ATPase subunit type 1 TsaE [Nesterenkonia sp. HG001]|uniref:tRNA (adenosine(37)-N6)-threonylcarbamoyltransferase complex ATPase subunit type 1 TsaE n=1 Tax=Nesterenkonia sp. HG001 TaxID=2983207 RepID=UPI002AC49ED3|nr:tRNA (adenosine(37)-N6)-threonylcarbamoyltransferase complex ATPase subunit type 1 TsaE [Nesterenkonia sp. HG001]MDZ5076581.1 tRNA (adenosine(37)-N6)-threonylcarbamoyltransferase complex ATPase subunit type 1 TsaE [Nesterenkonia sp. HG001]
MSGAAPGGADGVPAPVPGEAWTSRLELQDLDDTAALGRVLAKSLRAGDLLILTGGLGAGKTTFTQSLAAGLGVEGQISSPTFVLSRIHRGAGPADLNLVHVDAYRTDAAGFEDLDIAATLRESVTVVEWGRNLAEPALVSESGSWLDLELVAPESEGSGEGDAEIITDFSETEEDARGAARHAVLRGYGPRWSTPPDLRR